MFTFSAGTVTRTVATRMNSVTAGMKADGVAMILLAVARLTGEDLPTAFAAQDVAGIAEGTKNRKFISNMNDIPFSFASVLRPGPLATAWLMVLNVSAGQIHEGQRSFSTPDEAAYALTAAAQRGDKAEIHQILGTECDKFLTGEQSRDEANFQSFAEAAKQNCVCSANRKEVVLEIGPDRWPFPIPLAKSDGRWFFDTAAGKEEILNRRIGSDEMHAIGVCRAFAQKDQSHSPGSVDAPSPARLATLLAQAGADDSAKAAAEDSRTCHGYKFKILDGNANRTALLAFPEEYGRTGVMSFLVTPDGQTYQRDFGEKTSKTAAMLTSFKSNRGWKLVKEDGVQDWNIAGR